MCAACVGERQDEQLDRIDRHVPGQTIVSTATAALLADMPRLWPAATSRERQRLLAPLIERSYIDVEYRCVAESAPAPAGRLLLQNALRNVAQPICVLVEAAEEIDWAQS